MSKPNATRDAPPPHRIFGRVVWAKEDKILLKAWGKAVLPLFAIIAVSWPLKHTNSVAQLRFFQIAAAVIPTLLLALVIQRFFIPSDEIPPTDLSYPRLFNCSILGAKAFTLAYVAGGEAAALLAIARSTKSDGFLTICTAASLAAIFTAIAILAFCPSPKSVDL